MWNLSLYEMAEEIEKRVFSMFPEYIRELKKKGSVSLSSSVTMNSSAGKVCVEFSCEVVKPTQREYENGPDDFFFVSPENISIREIAIQCISEEDAS